jgi:protein ImuB
MDSAGVMAIVVAGAGGAVKDERSLLGNTRLDEVSAEAFELGVRPGHTIAAARARAAELRVRVVHEHVTVATLARLCEALLAFGRATSFSASENALWVDVTGCAHLFGGEEPLARALHARVAALGHACRTAIADGPRIATQIALFSRQNVMIVPPGEGASNIRALPTSALPIDGETLRWLKSSGLRTIADVQDLAKRARLTFAVRLGAQAPLVMAFLDGDDRAPLTPYVPKEIPEEKVDFEYGVTGTEALLFVAKRLSSQLAVRLEGRGLGTTRIEFALLLDRALLAGQDPHFVLSIPSPVPLTGEAEIFGVLRARFEALVVPSPALGASLRAPILVPRRAVALDLFVPEARAERTLPRLVAELVADLGEERVGTLRLNNHWLPNDRARLVPTFAPLPGPAPHVGAPRSPPKNQIVSLIGRAEEPTRLLPHPKVLENPPIPSGPVTRYEAIEWWRTGPVRHDFAPAWIERANAMAWVELAEVARVIGWID